MSGHQPKPIIRKRKIPNKEKTLKDILLKVNTHVTPKNLKNQLPIISKINRRPGTRMSVESEVVMSGL